MKSNIYISIVDKRASWKFRLDLTIFQIEIYIAIISKFVKRVIIILLTQKTLFVYRKRFVIRISLFLLMQKAKY